MKTPDKPREKNRDKEEENVSKPDGLVRFRKASKAIFAVSREEVLRAEEEARKKKSKP